MAVNHPSFVVLASVFRVLRSGILSQVTDEGRIGENSERIRELRKFKHVFM